jgi:hypothetical protein
VDTCFDRPGGHGSAEWRLCVCGSLVWQALGAQACRVDIVHTYAGLEGPAQLNRDHACLYLQHGRPWVVDSRAGLCIPEGCGPEERRSRVFVSPTWYALRLWPADQRFCRPVKAWRAQPSETKIVLACVGLRAWPGRDCECLRIPSFKSSSSRDCAGLRGWEFGV